MYMYMHMHMHMYSIYIYISIYIHKKKIYIYICIYIYALTVSTQKIFSLKTKKFFIYLWATAASADLFRSSLVARRPSPVARRSELLARGSSHYPLMLTVPYREERRAIADHCRAR